MINKWTAGSSFVGESSLLLRWLRRHHMPFLYRLDWFPISLLWSHTHITPLLNSQLEPLCDLWLFPVNPMSVQQPEYWVIFLLTPLHSQHEQGPKKSGTNHRSQYMMVILVSHWWRSFWLVSMLSNFSFCSYQTHQPLTNYCCTNKL